MDELEKLLRILSYEGRRAAGGVKDFAAGGLEQYANVHAPRVGGQIAGLAADVIDFAPQHDFVREQNPITRGLRAVEEGGLRRAEEQAQLLAEQDASTSRTVGRVALGEFAPTGAEYILAGRGVRNLVGSAVEVAPKGAGILRTAAVGGREALRDALAVLPLDAAMEGTEGMSTADAIADLAPETTVGRIAESARGSMLGRIAFGAATGLAADLGLRGLGVTARAVREGGEAARPLLREAAAMGPRGETGHLVNPAGGRAARDTGIRGLLDGSEEIQFDGDVTLQSVGRAFEERARRVYGRTLDLVDDEDEIVRVLSGEAREAMDDEAGAMEWYRQKLESAVQRVADAHPEMREDPIQLDAFRFALAVTSNGQLVRFNSKYALKVFEQFKRTGRFPKFGKGKEAKAMKAAFQLWNELADEIGAEDLFRLMDTEVEVRDLLAAGLKVSGELADSRLPAAVMFGPKIGGGFYRNLGGFFDDVTMDRWFRRTIGRITGDMLDKPTVQTLAENRARLREALGADAPQSDADLLSRAQELKSEWESLYRARPKGSRITKPEWALAAERFVENFDPTIRDAPSSGKEREQLRKIVRRVQDELERMTGDRPDAATVQAMVWYPEKRLYSRLGVSADPNDVDYDQAFKELLGGGDEGARSAGIRSGEQGRLAGPEGTPHREGLSPERTRSTLRSVRRNRTAAALAVHRRSKRALARAFRRRPVGRRVGGSLPQVLGRVVARWEPSKDLKRGLNRLVSSPVIVETRTPEAFHRAISAAKAANEYGAAVTVYTPEEYAGMRLFLSSDGKSGYALNGDDIVSVFKHPDSKNRGWATYALTHAVGQGGRRLDAFDTQLPHLYAMAGFEPVARTKFVDEFAPDGWRYDLYEKWNGGRPDVVAMVFNPKSAGAYTPGSGQMAGSYDEMIAAAQQATGRGPKQMGGAFADPLGGAAMGAAFGGEDDDIGMARGAMLGAAAGSLRRIVPPSAARAPGEIKTGMRGLWRSTLAEILQASSPKKPKTAEKWAKILKSGNFSTTAERAAVKLEEWLEWLETQGTREIYRDELLAMLEARLPRLTETVLGKDNVQLLDWRSTQGVYGDESWWAQGASGGGYRITRLPAGFRLDTPAGNSAMYRTFDQANEAATTIAGRLEHSPTEARYERYTVDTLGPHSNYREIVIQLDSGEMERAARELPWVDSQVGRGARLYEAKVGDWVATIRGEPGGWVLELPDGTVETHQTRFVAKERARQAFLRDHPGVRVGDTYTSSHWRGIENPLAHLRMTERQIQTHATIPADGDPTPVMTGDRVAFIEEIQSDWHQDGRKNGYRDTSAYTPVPHPTVPGEWALQPPGGGMPVGRYETRKVAEAFALMKVNNRGVPGAPFRETSEWVALSFERALEDAVESGADRLAWVSGEQAADLYDLRKVVDRIEWDESTGVLRGKLNSGAVVFTESGVKTGEQLAEYIGKEPAERLLAQPVQDLKPYTDEAIRKWEADARAGRSGVYDPGEIEAVVEGMRVDPGAWADTLAPYGHRGYGERGGADVGRFIEGDDLAVGGEGMQTFYDEIVTGVAKKVAKRLGVVVEAVALGGDSPTNLSFRITPEVREAVRRDGHRLGIAVGPLYQSMGGAAAGSIVGGMAAPEGYEVEGMLAGAAAGGIGMPLIFSKLAKRSANVLPDGLEARPKLPDEPMDDAVEAAAQQLKQETVRRPRTGQDIDAADHGNIASFALDSDGQQVLARELERVAASEGLDPKVVEPHARVAAEARKIAKDIGLDPGDLTNPRAAGIQGRAELVAMKNVVNRNVQILSQLEQEVVNNRHLRGPKKGMPLDAQELKEKNALIEAVRGQTDAILGRYIRDRTEAGRNLAAHKILANQTRDPFIWLARAQKALGDELHPQLHAEIVAKLEEGKVEEVAQLVASLDSSPIADQLTSLWKAGLLSAPPTHIVNVVSTGGNVALEALKDPVAAGVDLMITAALRSAAWAGSKARGHAAPAVGRTKSASGLRGLRTGVSRGARDFGRAAGRGGTAIASGVAGGAAGAALDDENRLRGAAVGAAAGAGLGYVAGRRLGPGGMKTSTEVARKWDHREITIDMVPAWLGGRVVNPLLDGYQKSIYRILGAEDKVFKAIRVEQSLHEQARVLAINERAKNVGRRAKEIYDGWAADGYKALPNEVLLQAIADGELATFTDRSVLAAGIGSMKASFQNAAKTRGIAGQAAAAGAEMAAPFTGTPSNVASRVVEYSGGGHAVGIWNLAQLLGQAYTGKAPDRMLQRQAAESFGRALTGAGVLAAGAMLWQSGLMTLNYPTPGSGEAGLWDIEGKQEFSVKQGDAWHSLERFSPVGNLLAVGGYMARAMARRKEEPGTDPLDIAIGTGVETGFGLTSMVMSQSFLEGTNRFLTSLQRGADSESGRSGFFEMQARSIVPNMVRRIAQAMDTNEDGQVVIRETDNWKDEIQAALPILREQLPLSRDALGEVRTRKGPASEFYDVTYSRLSKAELNDVRRELSRLGVPITRRRKQTGENIQQFSRRSSVEGRELYEALSALIDSDPYRTGVIDQARLMARTPNQVREIAEGLRKEMMADLIRATRSRQTRSLKDPERQRLLRGG